MSVTDTATFPGIGHNSGLAPAPAAPAPALTVDTARFAQAALDLLCLLVDRKPALVALKRQGGERMMLRDSWLYLLRTAVPRDQLAGIAGLYRGTVTESIDRIERLIARNGLLATTFESLDDMIEPLRGVLDNIADGFVADLVEGQKLDAELLKSLHAIKGAVDKLDRDDNSYAAQIHAQAIERRRQEWQDQLDRIAAAVETKRGEEKTRAQARAGRGYID